MASPENAKRLVGGSCLDPLTLPRFVLALLLVVKDGWLTGDFLAGGTPNKPYLPKLCSSADPKAALWSRLFEHW